MDTIDSQSALSFHQLWDLQNYSLEQCREAIVLLKRRIRQLTNADYQSYMEKSVRDLELSQRAHSVLLHAGLTTVGALMNYGLDNIWQLRGCGTHTFKEIKEAVLKDLPKEN